jgi:hypothetical protein
MGFHALSWGVAGWGVTEGVPKQRL